MTPTVLIRDKASGERARGFNVALALYWARWDQEQVDDSVFHQLEEVELSRFGASKGYSIRSGDASPKLFFSCFYETFRKSIPASAHTSQYSNFASRHHSTLLSQHVSLEIVPSHLPSHSYRVPKWGSWGTGPGHAFCKHPLSEFFRQRVICRPPLWMTWRSLLSIQGCVEQCAASPI